ncbi:apolipoprotein Bb, tandem duplicate 1 [Aulostomus maculatus]
MGDSKLCLLLLLSTSALTVAQDFYQPTCLLDQRYKTLNKYEYQYEAESLNSINGASTLKNGPKASCKVEIEVPQTCSFIVRVSGCSLSEVVDMDDAGNYVFGPSPSSDAFAAEMEKYPLKVVVEGVYDVKLYPEEGETTTILNIKRGIISALAVPLVEEAKNKYLPTIHGMCKTYTTVTAGDDMTSMALSRDLSKCDKFVPMRDYTSPLALISGMHYPLAQLVRSSQKCNYNFDNEKKHMTSGSCTENHILIPFSSKGEYGVTNVGKQKLTLVEVSAHNDRVFDRTDKARGLYMDAVEDKTVFQDKDAALDLLRQLATLPETEGDKRALLFHKLVIMVRGMKAETLSPAIPEALAVSPVLTYQVLAQCGTPECSSAIMQILRGYDSSALQVDATVFALGLVSNPSALLISDMLEMAKYKPSKAIMYALSNVVKRFYKTEGQIIPEIQAVAEFMATQLGDCSGDKDTTFLTLRVIGNMAPAVMPASPLLRSAVIQCVNQAVPLAVQQAAIQVYRLSPVPDEGREVLMQVVLDTKSAMQKRIAAYLVLMKKPQPSELAQLATALTSEPNTQVKSFVISHITNILSSTQPETEYLRQMLRNALQGNDIGPIMDPIKFSRNYKVGSVEGNMIFEGTSYLPKEMMLEMTLKAFGFDIDMMEIGMEGTGFEPTVEALFGDNGFFPDTVLKTMYFVSDNMPFKLKDVLQTIVPALKKDGVKVQSSQVFMREIGRNLNKLVRELKTQQSPEAMMYLRLLGNELGYLRTKDMEEMAYSAVMMIDNILKMIPTDLMMGLMTKADNTMFAHYIFMDNEFFLPTLTGVPLRIALSGTFTPGIKGGLKIARDMSEVAFMPSAGVEFVTQIGTHMPEYVSSGLEMHTNLFHESGLTAKISMKSDQIKMTIPAPTSPTKLIKMTNSLVAVIGSGVRTMAPMVTDKVDVSECTPFFAGMKYCTALQYIDAYSQETSPYFPFTGDSKFAVELQPTGEVTEYTVTVAYELLREGEEGKQKVDSVKLILRAEGTDPTEARAILKYNRRKTVFTADIQIPDYDVEAGLRLGAVDGNTKGKGTHSISLDLINKNIPQLSLVGRAKLEAMKQGMLQVQLLVPGIGADATFTANMKRDEELELELKSDVKVVDAVSKQKITVKYDASKVEVELKSDVNTETSMLPKADVLVTYGNQLLDMPVQADMKAREVFTKFVEAANNYMENYGADLPYIQNFRIPDMPEITLPETLFLNTETKAVYYFNEDSYTIVIPLPLGGKSTVDLSFPPVLTTPNLPLILVDIPSMEIPIPELSLPESITLSIPLFGKAEVSALMKSNLYDMTASMAAGKDVVETPSYSAAFEVIGTSPVDILSIKVEGTGLVSTAETMKAKLRGAVAHKFLEGSVSFAEELTIDEKISLTSSSKITGKSPFGLNIDIEHDGMAGVNTEEITGDSTLKGMFTAGPIYGMTVSTQSASIFPFRPEAKIDSSIQLDSSILVAQNTIAASFVKGEFSVVSNSKAFEDFVTHDAELSFKDSKLSLKSDANAFALGLKIRNQAQASAGAGEVVMRMETNADHTENRVYSLLTASLDVNGLAVNSDGTIKILGNEGTHKAALTMNKDGLTMSGTNALQSPLSIENTFNAGLDASKATLSTINKAAISDIKVDYSNTLTVTLSSLDFNSKADVSGSEYASYTHDITVDLKPYTASANANNNLKLLAIDFSNEAQLKAELYKLDLTGTLKATYGEEELKHIYQVTYADMVANAKCSTTGKLFGTQMNQNTELEIMGLAARLTNDARFNSQPIRFDETIRFSIIPFDVNFDAIFNADGDMTMYGKHSAQLYGKVLLRAQPLAFASTHEYRASLNQQLDNGFSLETTFDNKMDTVLSTEEQKASFRMKSKMNEQAFNNDMSVYNTPDRAGIELSSIILTNFINADSTDNQEFAISGFLKYDKSTESQLIQFPFMENVPFLLESIKSVAVRIAEGLKDYISSDEMRAKLDALPQYVGEFVSQLNIEGKVTQVKEYLSDFTREYVISMEDIEAFVTMLSTTFERLMADLSVYIQNFAGMMKEIIVSGNLPETLITKFREQVNAITDNYDIKGMVVYGIDTIIELMQQIDMERLRGTGIEFLSDIDKKYGPLSYLKLNLLNLKNFIESFDMMSFVADVKDYISSINYQRLVDMLVSVIPSEIFSDVAKLIRMRIEYYDIPGQINTFYAKLREMFVKFEVDQKVQAILEKVVELVKLFKIDETIQAVISMVKDADIPSLVIETLQSITDFLRNTEIKDIIQYLNAVIESYVEILKSLEYNDFVDKANQVIAVYTTNINEQIKALEIPQKFEATRDFVSFVLSSAKDFLERLREIKIAEVITSVKDIVDQVVISKFKGFLEFIKQEITAFDVQDTISNDLSLLSKSYMFAMRNTAQNINDFFEVIKRGIPEKFISDIQEIIEKLISELMHLELNTPSFIVPLTDLAVPSKKFSLDKLDQIVVPAQLDIPDFTIMNFYTVTATTISIDDIKQRIIALIDFIVNTEIKIPYVDAFFGDLKMNYLPAMPDITLPEITLPEISFPAIPQVPVEKLAKALQVPEIKLPTFPTEIMVPCFGKLYGEIRFNTPVYTMKTSAEFQNSTETDTTPQFTGFLTSQGTSLSYEILNYKLDSTAHIALPKMSRVVLAETVKFNHVALVLEHQASLTLYGPSAQAQAKTTVKVITTPYTADFMNTAFIAMEGGMSASLDTTYNHMADLPIINVKSDATLTQKAIVRQDGLVFTVTAENIGKIKVNAEEGNHKSNLQLSLSPKIITLTFAGDTDSSLLKLKQQIGGESVNLVSLKFDIRNEAEAPMIKNSLIMASGNINLYDFKAEVKANHDSELYGAISGVLSNALNIVGYPLELSFEFQNKGNAKVNIFDTITAKIDLQSDYFASLRPDSQQLNTVTLARLNQYKMFYNVTAANSEKEAGVFVSMEGVADLDFLTYPVSIPEIDLPFIDFRTPAVSDLNLYEQTGLKDLLLTTEQSIYADAKMVYQKSEAAPIFDMMGMVQVPAIGNLITDLSFKSSIINLNVNAGLYTEDDLVFRLGATTASEFESLKAKLDGTTSLTTKRGIKLANSLSLENRHIEGTQDSSVSLSTETLETTVSVATVAKITLPMLNLEANQNLVADNKAKANAVSTLRMKGDFNIPVIKAVGKADADHSLKLEGTLYDVSMESFTRANMDGTIFEDYVLLGILDNEVNVFVNAGGLRSTSKILGDIKLNQAATKLINMDINESLAVEASLSRVYALLKYASNNDINLFDFHTSGKHVAQATIDLAPPSMTADIEIDLSQPTSLGDFTIFEKAVAEVTAEKQKISSNSKFASPLYTTNMQFDVEGSPVYKVTFKSSATSVIVFLEYDMDASSTAIYDNDAFDIINKAILTHADLTMDVNQALSLSRQTLNVDITSPTFTDMNIRFAAQRDGVSASVSTPSTGFVGLQFSGRVPSQMSARLYGRYPSVPDVDIDCLIIRTSSKDADKMNLKIAYNMEAPKVVLSELKMKIPSIISTFVEFADKYEITGKVTGLMDTIVQLISDAYNTATNYDAQMSQLSIFYRNFIVQYQQTVQVFLDAAVKVLRETRFKLPGSDELTTLPEVLKKLTSSIAAMLAQFMQIINENMEVYYNAFIEQISSVKLRMPVGDALSGGQILEQVKAILKKISDELVDFVKNMESLDTMLVKIGETLKAVVDKSQELVDSVKSDYLDSVLLGINAFYLTFVKTVKDVVDMIYLTNVQQLKELYDSYMDMLISVVQQFNDAVYGFLQQASSEAQTYVVVSDGKLEFDLPFPFQQ